MKEELNIKGKFNSKIRFTHFNPPNTAYLIFWLYLSFKLF